VVIAAIATILYARMRWQKNETFWLDTELAVPQRRSSTCSSLSISHAQGTQSTSITARRRSGRFTTSTFPPNSTPLHYLTLSNDFAPPTLTNRLFHAKLPVSNCEGADGQRHVIPPLSPTGSTASPRRTTPRNPTRQLTTRILAANALGDTSNVTLTDKQAELANGSCRGHIPAHDTGQEMERVELWGVEFGGKQLQSDEMDGDQSCPGTAPPSYDCHWG
jgi:hypothetical protein